MQPEIADRLWAKADTISDAGDVELRALLFEASGFIAEQKQYADHMCHQIADRLPGDIAQRCDSWSSTLSAISRLKRERNNALEEADRLKARDSRWHAAYINLTSGDIVVDNGDLVGLCATNDLMLEFDTIAGEPPAQSLAEVQAQAIEAAAESKMEVERVIRKNCVVEIDRVGGYVKKQLYAIANEIRGRANNQEKPNAE